MNESMFIRSSDEEPLISPPKPFVRRGAFRDLNRRTRRSNLAVPLQADKEQTKDSLGINAPPENPNHISRTPDPHNNVVEVQPTFSSSPRPRNDRVSYLPPLPPSRIHDESLHRVNHDVLRKSQSLQSKNDQFSRESVSQGQPLRPTSPSPNGTSDVCHGLDGRKNSNPYTSSTRPSPALYTDPDPIIQPHQDSSTLHYENTIDAHRNREQKQMRESWNLKWFSAFRRPPSPSAIQRRNITTATDTAKQIQDSNPGYDTRRGFPSFFKRSSSPSTFYQSLTSENRCSNDLIRGSQPYTGSSSSTHSSPSSPTPSLTPQASPMTFHKAHNVPNHRPDDTFKRCGSFPLHKKQAYHMNPNISGHVREKGNDVDGKKFTGAVSFRRPSTPVAARSTITGFQREETNCFAFLPTSKPNYLNELRHYDPETVSLPIQSDPRYDKRDSRRRTTEISNITQGTTASADKEGMQSHQGGIEIFQRTHSLPATRREIGSKSSSILKKYSDNGEDAKENRSQSLNSQVYYTNRATANLHQTHESVAEDDVSSLTALTSLHELPRSRLVSSEGSGRSQDSFVSYISDDSSVFGVTSRVNSPTEDNHHFRRDLSRCSSTCSSVAGPDIYECYDSIYSRPDERPISVQTNEGHISYLLSNDEDYILCLAGMLDSYDKMCAVTPSHIRQHFDVLFKQLGLLYQFHSVLHSALKEAGTDVLTIADAFRNEQFECYKPYMIMTPTVQRDFHRHSTYIEEHFPSLKRDFLKPSVRINFYAMLLDSLKKTANEYETIKLQSSIDFLSSLKRQANTEMTIDSIVNSPVDLRLCGDMLMIGDIFCFGAGPLQKRKYNMILFENILLIASSKTSSFKYKIHYRIEQLENVKAIEDEPGEFSLKVLTEGQVCSVNFKFKVRVAHKRDQWVTELKKVISQTKVQYSRNMVSAISSIRKSQLLPLSLYNTYPQLLQVMAEEEAIDTAHMKVSPESLCYQLLVREKSYIKQICSLLNPEAIPPPEGVSTLLEKFYQFHTKQLLPELERSQQNGLNEALSCILDFSHLFQIYADYFVVRCQLNAKIERGSDQASFYISPVQHFTYYMNWLKQVSHIMMYKDKALNALQRFKDLVLGAQVRLLSESITNGKINFFQSGNLLRNDKMEVKTRKRSIHEGIYQVLLFEKIIILTKPKPPFYEYVWDIWLNQVNLGPPSNSERGFKLEVRQGRGREAVTFEFRATSSSIQQIWIKSLQQELLHQAENIRKRASIYSI